MCSTAEAVKGQLKNLNPNKVFRPDGIPAWVLKELHSKLAVPLCIPFNKSTEQVNVPKDWKEALVTAIFKKDTRRGPGYYRPVSLISIVCKMLESQIRDTIIDHMNINKLYTECQMVSGNTDHSTLGGNGRF